MSKIAESLRKSLRELGLRVGLPRTSGACAELIAEHEDLIFYIYLYPGRFTESIVSFLTPIRCGCDKALYCPHGLYAIAEPEGLPKAIHSKLNRLKAIATHTKEEPTKT